MFVPLPPTCHTLVSELENSILLETTRPDSENQRSYLFLEPVEIFSVDSLEGIPALFPRIEKSLQEGFYVAGLLSYEAGYYFEAVLRRNAPATPPATPLAWFGVYREPLVFHHASGEFESGPVRRLLGLQAPAGNWSLSHCRLTMSAADYRRRIERIKDYIAAGDTYQVNLTSKLRFDFSGCAAALFSHMRDRQKVPYAAFLNFGGWKVLSLSPELFFRIHDGCIVTRPMKGTAPRGRTLEEDSRIEAWLQMDLKNRSENVMIVDLLRNDLGRIAETGSIRVEDLFATEKYKTLFQMTSTVSGKLRRGTPLQQIFRAMFPSGSVTGAPKVRTMQLIRELETEARGVYTGTIGFFAPNGDSVLNVAIRTIVLNGSSGEMGVGSGIVFDSDSSAEYEEVRLKAEFLTEPGIRFELLESLLWDGKYHFLDHHLERLKASAEYFEFDYEESLARALLEQESRHLQAGSMYKVRLLLSGNGSIHIESGQLAPHLAGKGTVMISPHRVSSEDRFLYHKTTHRENYEVLYEEGSRLGHEDVIFANERGEITEGTRNNVFVEKNGVLMTPPVACGLLPGVFRRHLLETEPRAAERILSIHDLHSADAVYLSNSVRGLRRVRLIR